MYGQRDSFARVVYDAMPAMVFVVDWDVRIQDANPAALRLIGDQTVPYQKRLCGDVLKCKYAGEFDEDCGKTPLCPECGARGAVNLAREGKPVSRNKAKMKLFEGENAKDVFFLVTAAPFEHEDEELYVLIFEDYSEMVELRGIIPNCMSCKKVRNDQEFWESVEAYLHTHTELRFSHGICPDCARTLYPEAVGE